MIQTDGETVVLYAVWQKDTYDIEVLLTNLTADNMGHAMDAGDNYTNKLYANHGYELPGTVSITMGGADISDCYDATTGEITINGVSGDVVITAVAVGAELTGTVTVTGTPKFAETLTASVTASNNTGNLTYQWYRSDSDSATGAPITGAENSTYELAADDVGKYIYCVVSSDTQAGMQTSNIVGPVDKANGPAAPETVRPGSPSVSTASDGKLTGVDNTMEYATDPVNGPWTRIAGDEVSGLVVGTYYVRHAETATHKAGEYAAVDVAYIADALTGTLRVSGEAKVGATLTAELTDTNNRGELTYTWYRSDTDDTNMEVITTGSSNQYVPTAADVGKNIYCVVTSSEHHGEIASNIIHNIQKKDGPAAPNVTPVAPTTDANNDGKITGVNDTMEYSKDGITWISVPAGQSEVTGLEPGDYQVRVKETADTKAGAAATVTVPSYTYGGGEGGGITTYYTLSFNTNGGSNVADIRKPSGTSIRLNQVTKRDGYIFTGWYLDSRLTEKAETVILTKNLTVYAGWQKDMADPDNTGVSGWLNTGDHIKFLYGYPNGTFGPNQNMTRAEAARMFYNLLLDKNVAITVRFDDVDDSAWYAKAVNTLGSLGIIHGYGNGDFGPDDNITRAQFTAIAMRCAKLDKSGKNIFSDVPENAWYYDYVVGSVKYGWINGYSDGTYRPDATITRAEVTAITNRLLGRAADVTYINRNTDDLRQFSDLSGSYWAYYDIMEATNAHDYHKENGLESWTDVK